MHLGYPDAGHVSTYYPDSGDITKEEIALVSDFLEAKKLLPENTRLRKTGEGFEVLIASAKREPGAKERDLAESEWTLEGKLAGKKLKLAFGDHAVEMGKIADALKKAREYAANGTEASMMEEYVKSFDSGSLEAYKESQRYWIKDIGPAVETDIGFVEVRMNVRRRLCQLC
jgi:dipeptidyl-peptidase-3